jgi:single-strand DNA-binding protein
MNQCDFLGRITKDIEVKTVGAKDTAVANFTLAVNRKYKKEGEPDADFLNFVALGKTAEVMGQYCEKGSQIAVNSRVQTRNWKNKEGQTVYVTEFIVNEFDFVGSKNSASTGKPASKEKSADYDLEEEIPF